MRSIPTTANFVPISTSRFHAQPPLLLPCYGQNLQPTLGTLLQPGTIFNAQIRPRGGKVRVRQISSPDLLLPHPLPTSYCAKPLGQLAILLSLPRERFIEREGKRSAPRGITKSSGD